MLKNKIYYVLCLLITHQLNGSQTTDASIQNPSERQSSKKSFWQITTHAVAKIAAVTQPVSIAYAAMSLTALATMYGGYQLWRKFIFDSQLRAMKQELADLTTQSSRELKAEIKQTKQDINQHLSLEINVSELRQKQHTTAQIQEMKIDFQHRLEASEKKVIESITHHSHATKTIIESVKEQQKDLRDQINKNHSELLMHMQRRPVMLGFPISHPIVSKRRTGNTPALVDQIEV